jgi:hypothetical protein
MNPSFHAGPAEDIIGVMAKAGTVKRAETRSECGAHESPNKDTAECQPGASVRTGPHGTVLVCGANAAQRRARHFVVPPPPDKRHRIQAVLLPESTLQPKHELFQVNLSHRLCRP